MEKIKNLVERLNTQVSQQASLSQLLATVQMLQKEITGNLKEVNVLGTSGISVIVPHTAALSTDSSKNGVSGHVYEADKEYFELTVDGVEAENEEPEKTEIEIPQYEAVAEIENEIGKKKNLQSSLKFNDSPEPYADDLPTLTRQAKYNSKPKQSAAPKANKQIIKDLRKAINAQDRVLFIRELFRGDEIMFERSIRTINGFSILAEAEYWIRRELKTLNGWLPDNPATKLFEQLIRKRFA